MRCVECGHEIKDGAVFCIRCGAMQVSNNANQAAGGKAAGTGASANAQRNVKQFEPTPKRGGGGVVVFIIAAIAVLAAIVALAMFALNPGSSGDSSSAASSVAASSSASSSSASSSSSSASSSSASSSSKSASSKSSAAAATSASSASAAQGGATTQSTGTTTQNTNAQTTPQQNTTQQQAPVQQQTYTPPAPEPAPEPAATDNYYVLDDSSSRLYSKSELQQMSSYELWIARNEIFARHGRMFKDPDLQAYFNNQQWYNPVYTPEQWDASQSVSGIESKNAALMLEVEQDRSSDYL